MLALNVSPGIAQEFENIQQFSDHLNHASFNNIDQIVGLAPFVNGQGFALTSKKSAAQIQADHTIIFTYLNHAKRVIEGNDMNLKRVLSALQKGDANLSGGVTQDQVKIHRAIEMSLLGASNDYLNDYLGGLAQKDFNSKVQAKFGIQFEKTAKEMAEAANKKFAARVPDDEELNNRFQNAVKAKNVMAIIEIAQETAKKGLKDHGQAEAMLEKTLSLANQERESADTFFAITEGALWLDRKDLAKDALSSILSKATGSEAFLILFKAATYYKRLGDEETAKDLIKKSFEMKTTVFSLAMEALKSNLKEESKEYILDIAKSYLIQDRFGEFFNISRNCIEAGLRPEIEKMLDGEYTKAIAENNDKQFSLIFGAYKSLGMTDKIKNITTEAIEKLRKATDSDLSEKLDFVLKIAKALQYEDIGKEFLTQAFDVGMKKKSDVIKNKIMETCYELGLHELRSDLMVKIVMAVDKKYG